MMGKSGHPRGSKPWFLSLAARASRGNVEELPRDNHQGSERKRFHDEAGYMTATPRSSERNPACKTGGVHI
jgi:hypothetical protein